MSDNKNTSKLQLSLFDDLFETLKSNEHSISSKDLKSAIKSLQKAYNSAEKREENERKKRLEEERKERERLKEEKRQAHIEKVTCMDLPLDWENIFNSDSRTQGVHTDSISDGLIMSLTTLGKVDIEYISSITGEDYKTIICALKGSIYQNPEKWNERFYKGWETAEEYLSGNLMRKWQIVVDANRKYNNYFLDNKKAIEKVLPNTVSTKDIYITLGSPWVPTDIIEDFIDYLLGINYLIDRRFPHVTHDEITGTWQILNKSTYKGSVASKSTYGTSKIEAIYIIEKSLNMKSVAVMDKVYCPQNKSGQKSVINKSETLLAIEKQNKIIKEFQGWVWRDEKRKERLEIIFENQYSCVRKRNFDGSFLNFPNLSPAVNLYQYQKNAVARIIFSPNTLLAHDVGTGKTYVMIAAGMELRRMGLSKKNLYVVPNNIIGQWKNIFNTMYPNANILCVDAKNFTPKKRENTLERIRDEDFDAIIMAYSCFEMIPISKDFYKEELEEEKILIEEVIKIPDKITSSLSNRKDKVYKALAELELALDDLYNSVYFDELGITKLFVDEAHNFKNVPIQTKINNVLGISSKGSKKCQDMMDKVHIIQKQNDGGGVVMATGTPITNSITDAYIMQQYLQSGELAMLDLQNFDSWVGMFAEKTEEFEIDVDTNSYRLATRFSKFHNLPELTALLASVADFHQIDKSAGIPDFDGYDDELIGKTKDFKNYLQHISQRAEDVRKGYVSRKDDNMLKITTDGKKAALDLRLVIPNSQFTYQSKVARCAETVFDIYTKTGNQKSTQLVFCDTSTPKNSFNLYDELKNLLLQYGIPEEKIAFVHDADTEVQRQKLFLRMRNGDIRILIGSTFKLGIGVNIQDRLIAIHHLDVPWRPADMTQREGRIIRQGNQNSKVQIFRYITEGSFDAYSWQLLETKQKFISDLLSGSLTDRSAADIQDTVLDYGEVKALAVGNSLVKERVETANELNRYTTLQRKLVDTQLALETELLEIPSKINHQEQLIEKCKADLEHYTFNSIDYSKAERKFFREKLFEEVQNNILTTAENEIMTYQGFIVILPVNMDMKKPYVWLKKEGKYYVELGNTEVGGLIRIDNFLENLENHLLMLEENLSELKVRKKSIKEELNKDESYIEQIEEYKTKLNEIDKKLGVKQ